MSASDEVDDRVFASRHIALRNALYHTARRRWLDGWGRFLNLLIIVAGTSAATDMLGYIPGSTPFMALFVAFVGAAQLVYDFSGRGRTHELLQRRYYLIYAEISECTSPTMEDCAKWEAEFARAAADEPPTMRALDAIADNQATNTLLGGEKRLDVTGWQSITRQILAHNSADFTERKEWKPKRISAA